MGVRGGGDTIGISAKGEGMAICYGWFHISHQAGRAGEKATSNVRRAKPQCDLYDIPVDDQHLFALFQVATAQH